MSIFTKVQMSKPNSSSFDLSHQKKFSLNTGQIIPCMLMETLPGDKFNSTTAQLLRFAPMVAPMMHQVSLYTHFFYVPNRILWDNWTDFISKGESGVEAPVFPTVNIENFSEVGSLADYFGLPTGIDQQVNALPFAAYNKIYNEYYRDQNLIQPLQDEVVDGINPAGLLGLMEVSIQRRAWQHDYFTSALPWTQKGPQATIPLGDSAPVVVGQAGGGFWQKTAPPNGQPDTGDPKFTAISGVMQDVTGNFITYNPNGTLQADLSQATAASIIDLRNAFQLQEWLEKNARGGSRYNESIMVHFGVHTGDALINRPIFLGGGSQPISISEVLQTSASNQTGATTPQGNMAGHGISSGQSSSWSYTCKEHGFIVGLITVLPKTAYQQGVDKFWSKNDTFDFAFPSFAHIGEQPILNKEIYYDSVDGENDDVFGYAPRYVEYKYMNDTVSGEFKTTLDFWHWGRIFASRPRLNQQFIECEPDTRIFANELGEQCYVHMYHQVRARRLMPYFGNPKI